MVPKPGQSAHPLNRLASADYPTTPRGIASDDFHGHRIPDPYRWLEALDDVPVRTWIDAQNDLSSSLLTRLSDQDEIRAWIAAFWEYERVSIPIQVGQRTFQLRSSGLQQLPVLYVTDHGGDPASTRALVDPNELAPDGSLALTEWQVSPSASVLAYAISRGGSDQQEIRVRDIDTGVDLPDMVQWVKSEEDLPFPNVAWLPDSSGFFYNRLPAPDSADRYRQSQVYWHRVGTSQTDDVLIFERRDDPDLNFVPIVTSDGAYLILHAWKGLSGRHMVYVGELKGSGEGLPDLMPLLPAADARYLFLGNQGGRFFFHTDAAAPRGRVIAIDLARQDPAHWLEIVPEQPDPIDRAYLFGEWAVTVTVRDSHHQIAIRGTNGRVLARAL